MSIENQPEIIVEQIEHWRERKAEAERGVAYCEHRISELVAMLAVGNVIFVEDERWQK